MKERTTNQSYTALALGIMSVITVFGGYTAVLGLFFGLLGIILGARGKRQNNTAAAKWALRISILGFLLCLCFAVLFVMFYIYSGLTSTFDFDFDFDWGLRDIYEKGREFLTRFMERI